MTSGEVRNQRGYHAAAHAAHRLILEQHRELRRLLALGLVQTCMSTQHQQSALAALTVMVGRIRTVFVQHLADEEAALVPLLDDDLPGARRAHLLREEHARQRRALDGLQALSEGGNAAAVADRFDWLARALLIDIADEERELARAVAVLDDRASHGCDGDRLSIVKARHHGSRASRAPSTATG